MSIPAVTLATARLHLEPIGVARAARLLAVGLAELRSGPGWPHNDTFTVLAMAAAAQADVNTGWFILQAGEVIGEIGPKCDIRQIANAELHAEVEIGYGLGEGSRGLGYAREAVRAVTDWLLGWPGVVAITAEVDTTNLASAQLLRSLGFSLDPPKSDTGSDKWQFWRLRTSQPSH